MSEDCMDIHKNRLIQSVVDENDAAREKARQAGRRYHIGWRARATGITGQGVATFAFDQAQALANNLNASEPGELCYHYPVEAKQ